MPKKTLLKAEILLLSENEEAQHYLFHKLGHYPEISAKVEDDRLVLIGESAYISYILDILQRQLAKRYKETTLLVPNYKFVLNPNLLLYPSKEH